MGSSKPTTDVASISTAIPFWMGGLMSSTSTVRFHSWKNWVTKARRPALSASPVGITCRLCDRFDCRARAFPSIYRPIKVDENVRGVSFFAGTEEGGG